MKQFLMLATLLTMPVIFSAQEKQTVAYDSILAKRLGGNNNGMKKYIMVILKTGPGDTVKGKKREELFKGHMANINDLANEGKLVLAGPFGKNPETYRGIFVLNTTSLDDAKSWCERDPTVKAKVFNLEFVEWFGSAAVLELNNIHKRIEKPAN